VIIHLPFGKNHVKKYLKLLCLRGGYFLKTEKHPFIQKQNFLLIMGKNKKGF